MSGFFTLSAVLFLSGCDGKDESDPSDPDSGIPCDGGEIWYLDSDGDGFGDDEETQLACDPPASHVDIGGDCDDSSADVAPGLSEVPYDGLDNDCQPLTPDDDLDGDGYGLADDCDDSSADIAPDVTDDCDGVDSDCDGIVDDDGLLPWYVDDDGDGFGELGDVIEDCLQPSGTAERGGDCNDTDPDIHPGAEEVCDDGIDNDCNGTIDAGSGSGEWTGSYTASFVASTMGQTLGKDCEIPLDVTVDQSDGLTFTATPVKACIHSYDTDLTLSMSGSVINGSEVTGEIEWWGYSVGELSGTYTASDCMGAGLIQADLDVWLYPVGFWTNVFGVGTMTLEQAL